MAVRCSVLCLLGAAVLLAGCQSAQQTHDPEYADVSLSVNQAWQSSDVVLDSIISINSDLEGPHSVEEYIQFALGQNPKIQAARKRVEASAYRVPVAASLQDPQVGMTIPLEQVQTAAGEQDFSISANQKLPWIGKLDTRAQMAESQTNVTRAQLAAVELETIAKVKRAYYELYFIQQAMAVTKLDQKKLVEIRNVANTRYKTEKTSYQDLLRAELEISNVERQLIKLRQRLKSTQARLARILHIAPQTKVRALDRIAPEKVPRNLESLQRQALAARPALHAQLAALQRDQRAVDLAHLDYMPDVTLGATWIDVATSGISPVANGRDSFLITAGINLPIYRKRLDSSVKSAEAKAVSTARVYDSLRDATLEEVMDLFVQAQSQQDLLKLFRDDILSRARQTLEVSIRAYSTGEVDFLQLLDNWRALLRYEIQYRRLEASLRQTMAELERVVGGFSGSTDEPISAPLDDPQPLPPPE